MKLSEAEIHAVDGYWVIRTTVDIRGRRVYTNIHQETKPTVPEATTLIRALVSGQLK